MTGLIVYLTITFGVAAVMVGMPANLLLSPTPEDS